MALWCSFGPHPRDGPWAWLVCFMACFINVLNFGCAISFGVFLPVLAEYFNENLEKTAWVGSIALSLRFLVGPIPVMLSNRFSHRTIAIASGLLTVISLIASSFANGVVFLYFSYGIPFGFAAGCLINTAFVITSKYFTSSRRSITTGIITSGASLGVMSVPPTVQALIDTLGWRHAYRVMAGLSFLICIMGMVYDPEIIKEDEVTETGRDQEQDQPPRKKSCRDLIDCSVWKNITFVIGTVSIMLTSMGLFVSTIHIVRFAKDLHISGSKASQLFIYIGVCSSTSRIAIGRVIDKNWVPPLQCIQFSSIVLGVVIIALAWSTEYIHFIVFAIVFGTASGCFATSQALFLLTSVPPEKNGLGLGMGHMACSVLVLGGPPAVGFIADKFGSYIPSFYVIGGILLFSAVFPFSLRFITRCKGRPEYTVCAEEIVKPRMDKTKDKTKDEVKTLYETAV